MVARHGVARIIDMSETPTIAGLLAGIVAGKHLSTSEATWCMEQVMRGQATAAQLGGLLVGLRTRGETVAEIVGFREAVLRHAVPLPLDPMAVDIVGTGGDRLNTVNVSTTASIVVAAAGAKVIKHGNRAASSQSGASDVLGELGVPRDLDSAATVRVFEEVGIAFAFAPTFHPGFRHAGPVRAELGVPTVFNFLGPLCNPARPEATALGVAREEWVPLIVGVLQTRGATALVFRGDDGLDELSTTGHSRLWEVSGGTVKEHDIDPAELHLPLTTLAELRGGDVAENARRTREVLAGVHGPVRDIVLLNAAAGLAAYRLARDPAEMGRPIRDRLAEGLADAAVAIDSGAAARKLAEWVAAIGRETTTRA